MARKYKRTTWQASDTWIRSSRTVAEIISAGLAAITRSKGSIVMNVRTLLLFAMLAAPQAFAQSSYPALLADGPYPEYKDKLATFGQFVGVWTFDGVEYHDDGTRPTDKGELHFQWVLQGRAIQDVWIETERSDARPNVFGTTIRFYDPKTDRWLATWVDPVNVAVQPLVGRTVGSEIVLEGTTKDAGKIRWIFSDIKPDSFRWHGERLVGKEWRTYEELSARRKVK